MNTEFTKRWMNTRVSQTYDALVIGGGAAGMLAAGTAAARGLRTCLVEKNARPGRKLMITGKGRCNVTNDCDVQEPVSYTHLDVYKRQHFCFIGLKYAGSAKHATGFFRYVIKRREKRVITFTSCPCST